MADRAFHIEKAEEILASANNTFDLNKASLHIKLAALDETASKQPKLEDRPAMSAPRGTAIEFRRGREILGIVRVEGSDYEVSYEHSSVAEAYVRRGFL